MIIGTVGGGCTGKDTVAKILRDQFNFELVSTSELVRAELTAKGWDGTRPNQRKLANERRRRHGGNYWIREALTYADRKFGDTNLVVSDMYCVAEVRYLQEKGGLVIGVICNDLELRYQRLRKRYRQTHDRRDELTFQDFKDVISAESSGLRDDEPNVDRIIELANFKIDNSSTLDHLTLEIRSILAGLTDSTANPINADDMTGDGMLGELTKTVPPVEPRVLDLDPLDRLRTLENRFRGLEFVRTFFSQPQIDPKSRALAPFLESMHIVEKIGNQFAFSLMDSLLKEDAAEALRSFRLLVPHTTDEELALLLNDNQFFVLHRTLHEYLLSISEEIEESIIQAKNQIASNDRIQFSGVETMSLAGCRERGISIRILPAFIDEISTAQAIAGNRRIPVLELLKNRRIIETGLLSDSKISLAVHDLMDHVWFFSLLSDQGLTETHQDLFNQIGNPETTNIFKREGEIVASLAFGVRMWPNFPIGFTSRFCVEEILQIMSRHFDNSLLDQVGIAAFQRLRTIATEPKSIAAQRIEFVFSNYLTELDEQRRKHGAIKVRNRSNRVIGELDPWGPTYLSFFIQAMDLLLSSSSKHRDSLLRTHIVIEEFLCSEAALQCEPLSLDMDSFLNLDFKRTILPPDRIMWMSENYGFTASKDSIV